MRRKLTAVLLATMLVLTGLAPATASAQQSTDSEATLGIELTQSPETGNATVTVTNGSDPVAGATVNVTGDSYAGTGTYQTDADGEVELPNPSSDVDIDVEATVDDQNTTETFSLVPLDDSVDVDIAHNDDGSATVTVTQFGEPADGAAVSVSSDVAYDGNGTYEADENGTVELPEPTETVELTVTATAGNDEGIAVETIAPIEEFEVAATENDDGSATVTVTRDDAAVENATVTVSSDVAYDGNGTYETDENGTVELPEPEETTNVTIDAANGSDEATTTVTLSPVDTGLAVDVVQNSDGTATVTVTDDANAVENATVNVTADDVYEGTGTYNTSADGTVDLPKPVQNVTVTVVATNDSEEATATAELTVGENGGYANFGSWISSYVHQLQSAGYFGFGQKVSEFATENNPGNADEKRPDHAGPKDDENDDQDAEAESDDTDDTETDDSDASAAANGNGANTEKGDERGPPEHAKNDKDAEDESDTDDSADAEDESDADDCDDDSDSDDCDAVDTDSEDSEEDDDAEESDDSPGNSGGNGNGKAKGRNK